LDAPARPHSENGLGQRLLSLAVQVGVRLVQDNQEGIAIERTGKRHTLPLPGREHGAAFADLGLVPLGKSEDHLVHPGGLCGFDDGCGLGLGVEAGDVVRDRPGEELDILRQVADVTPKVVGRPLVECSTVQANLAPNGRPNAHDRPRQG
jgi:hypothetical protein